MIHQAAPSGLCLPWHKAWMYRLVYGWNVHVDLRIPAKDQSVPLQIQASTLMIMAWIAFSISVVLIVLVSLDACACQLPVCHLLKCCSPASATFDFALQNRQSMLCLQAFRQYQHVLMNHQTALYTS